jgi:hypothetical protein
MKINEDSVYGMSIVDVSACFRYQIGNEQHVPWLSRNSWINQPVCICCMLRECTLVHTTHAISSNDDWFWFYSRFAGEHQALSFSNQTLCANVCLSTCNRLCEVVSLASRCLIVDAGRRPCLRSVHTAVTTTYGT